MNDDDRVVIEALRGTFWEKWAAQDQEWRDAQEPCPHCNGTGQMLWRPPEQAGGVGEECTCEWCDGTGLA